MLRNIVPFVAPVPYQEDFSEKRHPKRAIFRFKFISKTTQPVEKLAVGRDGTYVSKESVEGTEKSRFVSRTRKRNGLVKHATATMWRTYAATMYDTVLET